MKKRILSAFIAIALVLAIIPSFSLPVIAETFEGNCGTNVTWSLDTNSGTLTISGTGEMSDYYLQKLPPWDANRELIKTIIVEEGVTSIGGYAFRFCSELVSVTLPSTISKISSKAFDNCLKLTKVSIPANVRTISSYAFDTCTNLSEVVFEENSKLETLYSRAFWNCQSLSSIDLPSSLQTIESDVFSYCRNLKSITIPANVSSISTNPFVGCQSLESISVAEGNIYYRATGNCLIDIRKNTIISGCKSSIIPADISISNIGNYAFQSCYGLTSIAIPNNIKSIGNYAFNDCARLYSITLTSGIESIGGYAFNNCNSLIEIYNGSDLEISCGATDHGRIGYYAKNIYSADEGKSNLIYKNDYVFYDNAGTYYLMGYIGKLTDLILPADINGEAYYIHQKAFYELKNIESVTFPNSLKGIGINAFYNCTSITKLAYCGTEAEWNNIPKESNWNFDVNVRIKLHNYSNGICIACKYQNPNYVSGVCGENLTWNVDPDTETLTISGNGEMINFSDISDAPWYSYNSIIKAIIINEGVTSIGDLAFAQNNSLTSISLPEGLTSIGYAAFTGNKSLLEVTIPCSVTNISEYAFRRCISLTNVIFDENCALEALGDFTFDSCDSLKNVKLPDSLSSIGKYAFYSCYNLESINIPSSLNNIGASAFANCRNLNVYITDVSAWLDLSVADSTSNPNFSGYLHIMDPNGNEITELTLPNNITSIRDYAFSGGLNLTKIIVPDTVTNIGAGAFKGCQKIESINIPDGISVINDYTFSNCNKLSSVTLPSGISKIGNQAFYFCSSLSSINIPYGVTSIGSSAFYYCSNLSSINIPYGVTSIGMSAFSNCSKMTNVTIPNGITVIDISTFDGCKKLTSITIPSSVEKIESNAFNMCISLKDIIFEENSKLSSIGSSAFYYCSSIESLSLPNSLTSISDWAFECCQNIKSITIPHSVTVIGSSAFASCINLERVVFEKNSSIKNIGSYAFSICNMLSSMIYCDSEEQWNNEVSKGSNWNSSTDIQFHDFDDGICIECGYECEHANITDNICDICGKKLSMLGDVNDDGEITNADVLMIFRYIYNAEVYPLDVTIGDVNKDGLVTNADVLSIYRYIYNPELYPLT